MKKKILISTGGSGGHVIPAMAFYDHLKENFDVFLVLDERGSNFINDAEITDIIRPSLKDEYSRFNPICGKPLIKIRNYGSDPLTSVVISTASEALRFPTTSIFMVIVSFLTFLASTDVGGRSDFFVF